MFSLIITVIAIALVTALALATIYYGGAAFKQGQLAARAATVVNQGQQILAAFDLFETTKGRLPNTLSELVPEYLTALPVTAQVTPSESYLGVTSAYAAGVPLGDWQLPAPQVATVAILSGVPLELCKEINQRVRGNNGVLLKAYPDATTQCYGLTAETLNIVVTRDGGTLVAGMGAGNVSLTNPPPATEVLSTEWLSAPGVAASSSGGGGTSGGTPTGSASFSLSAMGFGATSTGSISEPQGVTVTNTGTEPLTFTGSGATVGAPFAITANSCASATLAPSGTCSIVVTFAPTLAQDYTGASYALALQATSGGVFSLALTGTGVEGVQAESYLSINTAGYGGRGAVWVDEVLVRPADTLPVLFPFYNALPLPSCGLECSIAQAAALGYPAIVSVIKNVSSETLTANFSFDPMGNNYIGSALEYGGLTSTCGATLQPQEQCEFVYTGQYQCPADSECMTSSPFSGVEYLTSSGSYVYAGVSFAASGYQSGLGVPEYITSTNSFTITNNTAVNVPSNFGVVPAHGSLVVPIDCSTELLTLTTSLGSTPIPLYGCRQNQGI